jgi:hypothetical protein
LILIRSVYCNWSSFISTKNHLEKSEQQDEMNFVRKKSGVVEGEGFQRTVVSRLHLGSGTLCMDCLTAALETYLGAIGGHTIQPQPWDRPM